jgi:hypothetical protein
MSRHKRHRHGGFLSRKSQKSAKQSVLIPRLRDIPGFENAKLQQASPGGEKMSEVILDFVRPLAESMSIEIVDNRMLFPAVAGWNIALLPEDQRDEAVEELIKKTGKADDIEIIVALRDLLGSFIERKLQFFKDNQRWILDWEVSKKGDQVLFDVTSTVTH